MLIVENLEDNAQRRKNTHNPSHTGNHCSFGGMVLELSKDRTLSVLCVNEASSRAEHFNSTYGHGFLP